MNLTRFRHIRARRRALKQSIDAFGAFETWEETCVPSYVHPNRAAAYVAWMRLFASVDLAGRHTRWGPVLDFGASVGELAHVLPSQAHPYAFVEQEEPAVAQLLENVPHAERYTLEAAPENHFSVVFALDALEHNEDYAELLEVLATKLRPDGLLIVSGPTENALYKLGRAIARFDSHYHETDIHAIERAAQRTLRMVDVTTVPFGVPLFRISAWKRK
ncbi:MAG: methyltransferase domain-containing protein [Sandaracinaceae bacterium]|nr:methyltransferase domain-containing protein [Sandaracinaceae bacterium]